ncbi:conserved hypothetical protein [Hahella chejuensis KCTC 2396]|uniref:DUF1853 domain-containing protein n=1 Tax=Hahella chejuensis (strain KCTC 2396) TaxID=349521 RepID=Q2SDI0_HAHCH|nr:DUF1853 family protein [Hahella chejuensis]ABC31294.1 conserved hypothetical protein [Hahella chejuensis KCTC 2396]
MKRTQQQLLKDLQWTCNSPVLAAIPDMAPTQFDRQAPIALNDADRTLTMDLLNMEKVLKSRFLGPYFESLWRFGIDRLSAWRVIAHGLQVKDRKKTYGEFDFILQDPEGNYVHQEVAIKYYLGLSTPSAKGGDAHWFGPNYLDRLDLKLDKLLNSQILLSETPEARQALAHLGINEVVRQIVMKGYLFYPLIDPDSVEPSFLAAPDHLRGGWLPVSALPQLKEIATNWILTPKSHWLSPLSIHPDDQAPIMSWEKLYRELNSTEGDGRPQMLIALAESPAGGWLETARYFVVSDDWAESARASLNQ